MGMVYKRGKLWWCKYYVNGRPVRESTGHEKEKKARDFLKRREGAVAQGAPIPPRLDRITYDELADDLRKHYQTTGARDLTEAGPRLDRLSRFFQQRRAASIGPALITVYVAERQAETTHLTAEPNGNGAPAKRPVSNRTINIELALLKRMLRLAYDNGKLLRVPPIKMLKESPPRQGFFEQEAFRAVLRHLSRDLQPVATFAYITGWRVNSEILPLTWAQVDFTGGEIRLEPGTTKNRDGRTFPLFPELRALLEQQRAVTRELQRDQDRIIPHVFHRKGKPIKSYRKAWGTACKKAGQPGRIPHDFRRTAVRNMVRMGIPERVAMMLSGHKTRSVFDRYHIVSPGDLQEAGRKLAGTFAGTAGRFAVDTPALTMQN